MDVGEEREEEPILGEAPDIRKEHRARWLKTGALLFLWLCIGLYEEMIGPNLQDLALRTGSDYHQVTVAETGRQYGFLVGALIAGATTDWLPGRGDVSIAVSLTVAAGTCAAVPWASTPPTLFLILALLGLSEGFSNISGQKMLLNLWGEKSAGPLSIVHVGYPLGACLAPLISRPFLALTSGHIRESHYRTRCNISTPLNHSTVVSPSNSKIEYAYIVCTCILLVCSLIFYLYQFAPFMRKHLKPKVVSQVPKSWAKLLCSDEYRQEHPAFIASFFAFLFLLYAHLQGVSRIMATLQFSFFREAFCWDKNKATTLASLYWIAQAIGRIIHAVLANLIHMNILLPVYATGLVFTSVGIMMLGEAEEAALWVFCILFGLFLGPIYPSGLGWANRILEITGFGLASILIGGMLGGIVYLTIGGIFFDRDPKYFGQVEFGASALVLLTVVILIVIGFIHGDRFTNLDGREGIEGSDYGDREDLEGTAVEHLEADSAT